MVYFKAKSSDSRPLKPEASVQTEARSRSKDSLYKLCTAEIHRDLINSNWARGIISYVFSIVFFLFTKKTPAVF